MLHIGNTICNICKRQNTNVYTYINQNPNVFCAKLDEWTRVIQVSKVSHNMAIHKLLFAINLLHGKYDEPMHTWTPSPYIGKK